MLACIPSGLVVVVVAYNQCVSMMMVVVVVQVQPSYEPAVVERYRFEARVHGEQQVEAASMTTSTLAHVQQFAVASTTEASETLVGRADVEWHVMREDSVVEQATAKEITHHDVEVNDPPLSLSAHT